MKITEIIKQQKRTFSFEFFPPRDEISALDFGINIGKLMNLEPSFVTVTYGAGGSTQERTFAIVDYLQNKIGLTCMAHYTCVNASQEKIRKDIDYLSEIGIENLMLLRGDPPQGMNKFLDNPDGFNHASDLISFVKKLGDFCIGGAAYPEKHVEAKNIEEDLHYLKIKLNAGADFLVTQLFFINDLYFDFIDLAKKHGINCRIIPGIIPITNFNQIKKFVRLTGATIPEEIINQIEPYQDNPERIYQIGLDFAIRQCRDLLNRGAPGLHFYTLNKSRAAIEIFESITYEIKKTRI
jgi:methylenetetrahydrofolate reductase (NADPH)